MEENVRSGCLHQEASLGGCSLAGDIAGGTQELFSFPLKTLQPTWLTPVIHSLSAVLSFTQTPSLALKRAECVRKSLQAAASAVLCSALKAGESKHATESCHWPVVCWTVTALKGLSDHDGSNGSAWTCLPLVPATLPALDASDCDVAPVEWREPCGYSAHTFPHCRAALGEETSPNLTRIHVSLKQTFAIISLHDEVSCATGFTDHCPFWF